MNLRLHFDACLYQGRWPVPCYAANTYSFVGAARRFCERKAPRTQSSG